jgi:anthranilate phosphoribosyltransferase
LTQVLAGHGGGLAEAIALNAAAVLWLADAAPDLPAGLALARQLISTRGAQRFFQKWLDTAKAMGDG